MLKSILFVCTGNIFRSMSAEYAFKQYLTNNEITNWKVGSAWIIANPQAINPTTLSSLTSKGINANEHQQRKLSKELLEQYDVIVAMAENHRDFIISHFGHRPVLLFNELAIELASSVTDIEDDIVDYQHHPKAVEEKIQTTVDYIFDHIADVFQKANERYYLFHDFASWHITHRWGYPFIPLYETTHTIAFMSISIPDKEDGHILVIPKERYVDIALIPPNVLKELIMSIQHIGKVIKHHHGGYNILLNNGPDAGQYIFHSHFHIIPRDKNDEIILESWKEKKLSIDEFVTLNTVLLQQLGSLSHQ